MAVAVYTLCAVTAFLCAGLLFQAFRRTRTRLLLWSSLCFAGLTINSVLVILDMLILPQKNLGLMRNAASFIAIYTMIFGLVWDTD